MKCLNVVLVIILLVQVGYTPCVAQEIPAVTIGDRVRIKALSVSWRPLAGSIVTLNADSLILKLDKEDIPLAIPHASVTKLEVSRGKERNAGKGAGIGLLIGAGVGALAGISAGDDCSSGQFLCFSGPQKALILGVEGGGIGFLSGAFIGFFILTNRWEEVPLDRLRLSLTPQRQGGLALSASLAF